MRHGMTRPRRPQLLLAALSLCFACVALDNTKLVLAVPSLAQYWGGNASWIVETGLLAYGGLLLVGGALVERFGSRRTLLVGLCLFFGASLGAALAPSLGALLGSRALLGLGTALMTPASLAALKQNFDATERPRAIAIWSASFGAAAALGPLLGGLLLERWGWRALFFSNAPFAVLAGAGIVCLAPHAPLQSNAIASPPAPLLGVARFRGALWVILLGYLAFSGLGFVVAQYLQRARLHAPGMASLLNLPLPLSMLTGTLLAPLLMQRWGSQRALRAGQALACGGALLVALASFYQSDLGLCAALVPFAVGSGSTFANATETALGAIPEARAGVAAAMSEASFELGGVVGIALLGALFEAPIGTVQGSPLGLGASLAALGAAGALLLALYSGTRSAAGGDGLKSLA